MSMYSFLKEQSPAFQDETLGEDLGKKLRSGALDSKKFLRLGMDDVFRPMSLEEMQAKEDMAFSPQLKTDSEGE